jgi:hypothetical protein
MAIIINFVLFERTFKVIYYTICSYLAWFSKSFDRKQCAVRHLGIIIDLIIELQIYNNIRLHASQVG